MTARFAITNASVRTLDTRQPIADAIAWTDGVIVAVGESDVRRAIDAGTEIIDGSGRTVTPGLVDGHQHLFMGAERARGVDLNGARDLDEFRTRVRAGRAEVGPDTWLLGYGAEYAPFRSAPYHYELLAGADGTGPMLLWSFDMHSAFVNEAALRMAGVTGARHFADASCVVCDDDGRPTGELREWLAMDLVGERTGAPPLEVFQRAMKNVMPVVEVKARRVGGGKPTPVQEATNMAYAAAAVVGAVLLAGFLLSFFLPEPAPEKVAA